MAYNGCPEKARQDRRMLELLAAGRKPRAIAAELGCSYSTLRRRLSRYVKAIGCATPEHAVARLVAERISAVLPLALRSVASRAAWWH